MAAVMGEAGGEDEEKRFRAFSSSARGGIVV